MKQSASWKTVGHSASQDTSYLLQNPEGSLPCSQEPINGPYPESDENSPQLTTVLP
jgi:hypothetical protein